MRKPSSKNTVKLTNLKCPISGKILLSERAEGHVMDPSTFYFAEGYPQYRYERHPFSWNILTQVYGGDRRTGSKALGYWRLNEDNSCTEMMKVDGLPDELIPKDTPQAEIRLMIENAKLKEEIRRLEFLQRIQTEPLLPTPMKINAKSIASELVSVQPMSAPNGKSFMESVLHIDYTPQEKVVYPYEVTRDNIENVLDNWKKLPEYEAYPEYGDIQIGDIIDEWDDGGWESLAGRAGESVIRNGIELYSRLTRMS